jgi:hypothetical protein
MWCVYIYIYNILLEFDLNISLVKARFHRNKITLLPLKVLMPWVLGFFTYSSVKEHFTSIVGLEGNRSYKCQSLQLRNNGFWVWGGLATANPSKISLSQFWTMSTFHMARALLTETVLNINVLPMYICHYIKCSLYPIIILFKWFGRYFYVSSIY